MLILEWFAFCYQKKTTAYNLIEDINHKMLHNKFKNSFVNTSKFIYTFRIKIKLLSWYMQKNALLARVLGHYTIVHEGVHGIGTWNILNTSIPYHLQLSFAGCFFILRATDGAVSSPSSPNNMSGGSASAVNGVIVSPNFPGQYPRNTQCTYWLVGRPQQSVRLIFSSFFVDGYTPYAFGFPYVPIESYFNNLRTHNCCTVHSHADVDPNLRTIMLNSANITRRLLRVLAAKQFVFHFRATRP